MLSSRLLKRRKSQVGGLADFVIWRTVQDRRDHKPPLIVVECKSDNVTIKADDYAQGDNYLLDQQIRQLEKAFLEEGGLRERMTRARIDRRNSKRRATP